MPDADEYRAILSGEARRVDVTAIESELTLLWKAAAEDDLEGRPVVRACVLNLVAYAPGRGVGDRINRVIAEVSGRHPSRSIVVVARPGARTARPRVSISAHCQIPPEGGKQVCSEQVTVEASGAAIDELHGTLLPLLVPDLPVFLWWSDEPPLSGHLFREMVAASDRLIVDSAGLASERVGPALAGLRELAVDGVTALSDLNWSRLTHWRELIAQFFDAPPASRYLERLDRVAVDVASGRGRIAGTTEGLLLVGWLASRLGWTLDARPRRSRGVLGARFRSAAGRVAVELNAGPARSGEGLHTVRLAAPGGAAFSVSRLADDPGCVAVTAEIPEGGYSRTVRIEPPTDAALLCRELEMPGRDSVFEEALAEAVRLLGRTP